MSQAGDQPDPVDDAFSEPAPRAAGTPRSAPKGLLVVGTPIGNLADLSPRASDALRDADLIAAEDTRHSLRLLNHLGLRRPLISYHEHNEARRTVELLEQLRNGSTIALVSDAGMPTISDPGRRLIAACRQEGVPVQVIPGPSSVVAALAGSGFPADRFFFGGFLPVKSGQRERAIRFAMELEGTAVFLESPHRILKTLICLTEHWPEVRVCVAREMTKHFEEYRIGSPAELTAHYEAHPPKGEITVVLDASKDKRKATTTPGSPNPAA